MQSYLDDEDAEVRRRSAEALRGAPSPEAMSFLLRAMADSSWRVRKTASEVLLEDYPMDSYINGLLELLCREDDAGARNSAIEALVRLGKKATPYLMRAFETPDRDVRKFVIDIIGEIKDRQALPVLLKSLRDDDDNVRASAVEYLGSLAEPAVVDELVKILREGDVWTAFPAADALGRIGDRRAVPALVEALSVKALREPVLKSLGRLAAVETLEHVVPLLTDKSRAVQEEALKAVEMFYHNGVSAELISGSLAKWCGPDGINILISHGWSKKREVRASAVLLLGLLQDERGLVPLLDLSLEDDLAEDVKNALVFAGRKRPDLLVPLFTTDNQQKRRFLEEVASLVASPIYYPVFERDLSDADGHVRAFAAAGLANIGDGRAIGPLQSLLSDPYEDVQEAAVRAIAKLGKHLKAAEFVEYLKSPKVSLRRNSALILGCLSEREAVSALGFALKDVEVPVRSAVVKALSSIEGAESSKYLMFALTDEDPDVRISAALSLGTRSGEGVFEALNILLTDPNDKVRAATVRSLGFLGDARALNGLVALLSDHNGFVVTAAIEALGRLGGETAKGALTGLLGSADAEIRRTVIKTLSSFGGVEAVLLPCLKDPDWAARIVAVEALCKSAGGVRAELERLYDSEDDPAVRRVIEECLSMRGTAAGPEGQGGKTA